ncbi:MAG: hypothetical protein ACHQE6_00380 [Solirubrobacterales bacterium]
MSATTTSATGEPRRFEPVPDPALLAAIDRAERHHERRVEGASMNDIAEHLGFAYNSATSRGLRPHVDALIEAGALVRDTRNGAVVWALTDRGRRRAARARLTVALAESPQYRVWRDTREKAAERIDFFREQVRRTLEEAGALLDGERPGSEAWFDLSERLQLTCWQLGSATHCLHEWGEPDDTRRDVDDRDHTSGASRYRRSTQNWEAPPC